MVTLEQVEAFATLCVRYIGETGGLGALVESLGRDEAAVALLVAAELGGRSAEDLEKMMEEAKAQSVADIFDKGLNNV